MIEEIALLTGSLGRSIPQALFEVGRGGPEEMQPAFEAASRTWLVSTDFARSVAVLKAGLADATADQVLDAMAAHPVLIQRPIVIRGDRAIVARPAERVLELLDDGGQDE